MRGGAAGANGSRCLQRAQGPANGVARAGRGQGPAPGRAGKVTGYTGPARAAEPGMRRLGPEERRGPGGDPDTPGCARTSPAVRAPRRARGLARLAPPPPGGPRRATAPRDSQPPGGLRLHSSFLPGLDLKARSPRSLPDSASLSGTLPC